MPLGLDALAQFVDWTAVDVVEIVSSGTTCLRRIEGRLAADGGIR